MLADPDKQVFPKLDLVGWYATGESIDAADLSINQEIMAMNESPCILLLDTSIDPLRKNLPVTLYETEVHVLDGAPVSTLVTATYSIETSDAGIVSHSSILLCGPLIKTLLVFLSFRKDWCGPSRKDIGAW